MRIALSILAGLIGYFFLMVVSVNLVGMIIRGFVPGNENRISNTSFSPENLKSAPSVTATTISVLLTTLFFILQIKYLNVWFGIAAGLLMVTRIPDLLYEMKSGTKISLQNMPKRPIDVIANIGSWLALPIICYGFFQLFTSICLYTLSVNNLPGNCQL
jgi:hypothetical protein